MNPLPLILAALSVALVFSLVQLSTLRKKVQRLAVLLDLTRNVAVCAYVGMVEQMPEQEKQKMPAELRARLDILKAEVVQQSQFLASMSVDEAMASVLRESERRNR